MIPKIIHYCWFGKNDKPLLAKKCIESWNKFCPDYEIIEWNEDNFDIYLNEYTKWCYENKKYAFLSDYIRLLVIEQYGGIYLDTDVEILKSLAPLLEYDLYLGFENNEYINTGLGFGAIPNHTFVKDMIREYDELLDGKHGTIGCPELNTAALKKNGLILNGQTQNLKNAIVFSKEYFNPYDSSTGIKTVTQNTYSIHWYAGSWMSNKSKLKKLISKPLHRYFGKTIDKIKGR